MATSQSTQQTRFPLGQHVEVLQKSKGLRGSWKLATIVTVKNGRREVEYDDIFQSDGVHKLRESFSVTKDSEIENKHWLDKFGTKLGFLRPVAPKVTSKNWTKGLFVDAFDKGAWWEGVILEDTNNAFRNAHIVKIFFPDRQKESLIHCKHLRISHQWDEFTGEWEVRGYWKGFSLPGGKDTSYQEVKNADFYKPQTRLALACNQLAVLAKDAQAAPSPCQKIFKELIESKKNAARQFFLKIGYRLEFHQRIGRGREAVYISPHGRRFYSLTMACKAWKKEQNMECNLGACKSRAERLLCIYDLPTTLTTEERSPKVAFLPMLETTHSKQEKKVCNGCQRNSCDYDDRNSHSPSSTITEASKGCRALLLSPGTSSVVREVNLHVEKKERADEICSTCGDGGELLLCDHCPSTYHAECVGLEVIPEGNWYCFGCCCASCEGFLLDSEDGTLPLTCKQCEKKYHVNCSPSEGGQGKQDSFTGNWFCGMSCEQVYKGLDRQLGIAYPLEGGGLSWMLLKSNQQDGYMSTENKLLAAHAVLQECFVPMIDVSTGIDIISQTLFSQPSDMIRLNCLGFYTLILERGCELISVATFRIHGTRLAEMPFIGTQFYHRRKGMCRRLIFVLEKMLQEFGVRKLLLPAVPQLLKTWKQKFEFRHINSWDRMEISRMNLMRFPGTILLKKNMVLSPVGSQICFLLNTQQELKTSGTSSVCGSDFRRCKKSRYKTQMQDIDVEDTKVVVATTKYKRKVKSPQWYVDSMKELSNDAELLKKERRSRHWKRKQKKTLVDVKIKRRRWAKHATYVFRSRFKSSIPAKENLNQGDTISYDSIRSIMPAMNDLFTFLVDTQDPPSCDKVYTRRKTKAKPLGLNRFITAS